MLGRPEVDPHGDPIPDAEGIVKPQEAQSLLTCPLHTPVTVMRVIDQDKVFLRFIENHNLKPGESIEVEERDAASDSVRVRGKDDQRSPSARAPRRSCWCRSLAVAARARWLLASAHARRALAPAARRRSRSPTTRSSSRRRSTRRPGIFQNIFDVPRATTARLGCRRSRRNGRCSARRTSSPTRSASRRRHGRPASATSRSTTGCRPTMERRARRHSRRAFADPAERRRRRGLRQRRDRLGGEPAVQQAVRRRVPALNAGFTHYPAGAMPHDRSRHTSAASGIWRAAADVQPDARIGSMRIRVGGGSRREAVVTLSPGLRGGWNSGDAQTIVGVAVPVAFADGDTSAACSATSRTSCRSVRAAAVKRSTTAASSAGSCCDPLLAGQPLHAGTSRNRSRTRPGSIGVAARRAVS